MMSDKTLLRISAVTAAAGMIALYLIVAFIEPRQAEIADLKVGENVLVGGAVSEFARSEGNIFFRLTNGSSIKVVMFANDAERMHIEIKDNNIVMVKGKVQYYRNSIEIIAKEIRIV